MQETWFDPWVGKILWRRKRQPIPVFLPGKSHGQRSLASYSPCGCKESDMSQQLNNNHVPTSLPINTGPVQRFEGKKDSLFKSHFIPIPFKQNAFCCYCSVCFSLFERELIFQDCFVSMRKSLISSFYASQRQHLTLIKHIVVFEWVQFLRISLPKRTAENQEYIVSILCCNCFRKICSIVEAVLLSVITLSVK